MRARHFAALDGMNGATPVSAEGFGSPFPCVNGSRHATLSTSRKDARVSREGGRAP